MSINIMNLANIQLIGPRANKKELSKHQENEVNHPCSSCGQVTRGVILYIVSRKTSLSICNCDPQRSVMLETVDNALLIEYVLEAAEQIMPRNNKYI